MTTVWTSQGFYGASEQPNENFKRTAQAMALARKGLRPVAWELAKTLMYSLSLPFSLIYHDDQLNATRPIFESYKSELEHRENPRIAAELEAEGYGNVNSQRYKQEFFKRLAAVKSADERYGALSRKVEEHQNGAQCAVTLFMTYMIAWQNHLRMGEARFVAFCGRIVAHLQKCLGFALPDGSGDFAKLYRFMKDYKDALGN